MPKAEVIVWVENAAWLRANMRIEFDYADDLDNPFAVLQRWILPGVIEPHMKVLAVQFVRPEGLPMYYFF